MAVQRQQKVLGMQDYYMFAVADQRNILKSQSVIKLIDKVLENKENKRLAFSLRCGDVVGNPCVFHSSLIPQLLSLEGDKGGRSVWGRMLGRVNGVNFTGIYGGTRAMGWQNIKLPEGYTWKEYMYFLLDTLPEETKQSYLEKLRVSREFWKYKGGCLDLSTIRKLTDLGIKFYVQKKTNYKTDKLPVQMDYLDDIDIAEFKEIPTYKRMCICILKNDHVCKYMGFALTKKEKLRRDRVMQKYKNIIK